MLIEQLMDEVDIDRGRAGTIVKMKRVLRAPAPQDRS
jgi:anti-sigma regulatory factor (Ser/Thr protein kinase)